MSNLTRRSLLAGAISLGAVGMAGPVGAAPGRRPFFRRIGKPIGLQLYMLGEEVAKDIDGTFARVAAIGYRDIEIPSLYGRRPAELKAAADRAGLGISSLHLAVSTRGTAPGPSLASDPHEIAEATAGLGARRVVVPIVSFPDDMRPRPGESPVAMISRSVAEAGPALWERMASRLNEKAAALQPLGIALGYHNHNLDFAPTGGTTGWDILVRRCDPRLVTFEVDIGWVATAGRDPAALLRGLTGRVAQLHVKDVARDNPVNFALSQVPADVGAGALDLPRILAAAADAGVEHYYVEQEPPFAGPRIEAARRAYAYLSEVRA